MKALTADDPRAIGEYRLRAQLGSGGMGRVYLGLSPAGRAVAIKVVNPDLAGDEEFLHRFAQEVAAARVQPEVRNARRHPCASQWIGAAASNATARNAQRDTDPQCPTWLRTTAG